jgi:sucrose-phosphate synthase
LVEAWSRHISFRWHYDQENREQLADLLTSLAGVVEQSAADQNPFKYSVNLSPEESPQLHLIKTMLRKTQIHVNLIFSDRRHLDVLPVRASKGNAIRWLAFRWQLPMSRFFVAGDSGNDLDMVGAPSSLRCPGVVISCWLAHGAAQLRGGCRAIVVANHHPDLNDVKPNKALVFYSTKKYAAGVLEGLQHYKLVPAPGAAAGNAGSAGSAGPGLGLRVSLSRSSSGGLGLGYPTSSPDVSPHSTPRSGSPMSMSAAFSPAVGAGAAAAHTD